MIFKPPPIYISSITLTVKSHELVAVVGPVGSGKSSMLSALLGEMEKTEGVVNIKVNIFFYFCLVRPVYTVSEYFRLIEISQNLI